MSWVKELKKGDKIFVVRTSHHTDYREDSTRIQKLEMVIDRIGNGYVYSGNTKISKSYEVFGGLAFSDALGRGKDHYFLSEADYEEYLEKHKKAYELYTIISSSGFNRKLLNLSVQELNTFLEILDKLK